jgi:hypothetical protein
MCVCACGNATRLPCHRLPEHLHAQHVGDDLLRLLVDVRVHQRHVVVARDAVACGVRKEERNV